MGPRAGLDRCGKSRHHRDSIPECPARSESLYGLRYPGPRDEPSGKGFIPIFVVNSVGSRVETSNTQARVAWQSHRRTICLCQGRKEDEILTTK